MLAGEHFNYLLQKRWPNLLRARSSPLSAVQLLMMFDWICHCESDRSALTTASHIPLNANIFATSYDMLAEQTLKWPKTWKRINNSDAFVIVVPHLRCVNPSAWTLGTDETWGDTSEATECAAWTVLTRHKTCTCPNGKTCKIGLLNISPVFVRFAEAQQVLTKKRGFSLFPKWK